jgi:DNA repair protein RadC
MNDQVTDPRVAIKKAKALVSDWYKEHFIGIYLNACNVPTKIELISLGTLDSSPVHPRETFRPALVNHAVKVIVLHNHPSGDVQPSEEDIQVMKRLKTSGVILGIELVDSIIFAKGDDCYSMAEKGVL